MISTVILTGMMLTIGAAVWGYTNSATSTMSKDYVDETLNVLEVVNERFTVEHVCYFPGNTTVRVWVYNYGRITIEADVYATISASNSASTLGTVVASGSLITIDVTLNVPLSTPVTVKVHSGRMNNVYYDFYRS